MEREGLGAAATALNPGPGLSLRPVRPIANMNTNTHELCEPKQRLRARSGRGRVVEWNVKGLELQLPL